MGADLLVSRFEVAQQLVTALYGVVGCFLARFVTGHYSFHLFRDDVADLNEVAKAQAFGVLGGLVQRHLLERDIRTGVLIVVALFLA